MMKLYNVQQHHFLRQLTPSSHFVLIAGILLCFAEMSFANKTTATIEGYVYSDPEKFGKYNSKMLGLAGWLVYSDLNNNRQWDSNEPVAVSDADGFYVLKLSPGKHAISREDKIGWEKVTPVSRAHVVEIKQGQKITRHFANFKNLGTAVGYVYQDQKKTGHYDSGFPRLKNWTIYSDLNNNGQLDKQEPRALSDEAGKYSLDLSPGSHRLKSIVPEGWHKVTPIASAHTFDIKANQNITRHFGNYNKSLANLVQSSTISEFSENKKYNEFEIEKHRALAHYPLHTDARDHLGAFHAKLGPDTTFVNDEVMGPVANFLGSSVSGIDLFNLDQYPKNFSISLWIKRGAIDIEKNARYFDGGLSGGLVEKHYGFAIRNMGNSNNPGIAFTLRSRPENSNSAPMPYAEVRSSILLDKNTWRHVVAIKNGRAINLYVDGESQGQAFLPHDEYRRNSKTRLGSSHFGSEHFKGQIADVRIYEGALRNQDISLLYFQGKHFLKIEKSLSRYESLYTNLLQWLAARFDRNSGGFYYAKSSHEDTNHFPPVIESTAQATSILQTFNLITSMPQNIKNLMISFFQTRQNPKTGYFLDPHTDMGEFERMKGRALGYSRSALSRLGSKPLYPLPGELLTSSTSQISLMNVAVASSTSSSSSCPSTSKLAHPLRSPQNFRNWIDDLSKLPSPWGAYDQLSAYSSVIRSLPSCLQIPLLAAAFDELKHRQNPMSGFWGTHTDVFNLVSATLKTALFYSSFKQPMPRSMQIYLSLKESIKTASPSNILYIYNTVSLLNIILSEINLGTSVLSVEDRELFVNFALENIPQFSQKDGGFSRFKNRHNAAPNNGIVLGKEVVEGEMNSTSPAISIFNFVASFAPVFSPFNFSNNDFSISVFVRIPTDSFGRQVIVAKSNNLSAVDGGYVLEKRADNRIIFTYLHGEKYSSSNAPPLLSTQTMFNDGKWHHVVVTWSQNSKHRALYVDGVLESQHSTRPTVNGVDNTKARLIVGASGVTIGRSHHLIGDLKELKFYNSALTSNEVRQLYNKKSSPTLQRNLIFHLPLSAYINPTSREFRGIYCESCPVVQKGNDFSQFNGVQSVSLEEILRQPSVSQSFWEKVSAP